MKFNWKAIAQKVKGGNRLLQLMIFFGILCVVAQWLLILLGVSFSQETVFLHYTIYFGVDRAGSPAQLLWIPVVGTGMLVLNSVCAFLVRSRQMRMVLIALMNAMEVLCVIACLLLVIINRSA